MANDEKRLCFWFWRCATCVPKTDQRGCSMKGSKKTRVLLVVFFCLLFGVVRNADAFGQETAKKGPPSVVNFMTFIVSGYQWPNFVAQDKGFLVDENIKLNWQEVRSTPDMLRFLSTGA